MHGSRDDRLTHNRLANWYMILRKGNSIPISLEAPTKLLNNSAVGKDRAHKSQIKKGDNDPHYTTSDDNLP
jgi:hypothetical protein